jgi:HD-GYP domain-containing protein (c-di-GMP phosphodiesterase class II)/DNA-binding CsgD family transcriptional regulator
MTNSIRLADLLGSLSFAGDLGRGQPMGHVLRTTRIAMALADRVGVPSAQLPDVYFTALLVHAGCTAGAAEFAAFLASDELSAQKDFCLCDPNNLGQLLGWLRRNVAKGQPLPARTLRMLQLMSKGEKAFQDIEQGCSEVGSRIASRLGLTEASQIGLYHICETWNGKGPHKLKGEDIPLTGRIVNVAMILEVFFSERGVAAAKEAAATRKGKSFDPSVADAAIRLSENGPFWEELRQAEPWSSVLSLEPGTARLVDESSLDDFAYALADIVDLKSATASTHSRRTAEMAERIAIRLQLSGDDVALTRRAALVHDVGMVAVPSFLLERGAAWSEADFERFRLHAYYTERILSRSEVLRPIGNVAASHHEDMDGSGYHRGLTGNQMPIPAKIVAAASAYVAAAESNGDDPERVISSLKGRRILDPDCLAALDTELGGAERNSPVKRTWPAGLTEREVEVLRLVASGLNLRETAERLVISDHTARHHLESVYSKAGVSSRAGVTLFAVENGLTS